MGTKKPKLHKYSVLLLYPDYLASNYGEETYYAWVEATDAHAAATSAQQDAWGAQESDVRENHEPADFLPLAVIKGHIELELGVQDFT